MGGPGHWRISLDWEDLSKEVVLPRVILDGRDSLAKSRIAASSAGNTATAETLRKDRGHSMGGKRRRR